MRDQNRKEKEVAEPKADSESADLELLSINDDVSESMTMSENSKKNANWKKNEKLKLREIGLKKMVY